MTDNDRPDLPTLRRAARRVERAAESQDAWTANQFQERVKARFFRRLEEMSHVFDRETAFSNPKHLELLAGTDRIVEWLKDPHFAAWFQDEEYLVDTIAAEQRANIDLLRSIRDSENAHASDRLKAARMLLELADAFPGRKSEIKFLDDRLNSLTEAQTEKEIRQITAKLEGSEDD